MIMTEWIGDKEAIKCVAENQRLYLSLFHRFRLPIISAEENERVVPLQMSSSKSNSSSTH